MTENPAQSVNDLDKLDPTKSVTNEESSRAPPEEGKFQSYMKDNEQPIDAGNKPSQASPIELNSQNQMVASKPPSLESVNGQMSAASGSLGDIREQLNTKGLKLKQSQKYLLRNKLTSANEHIRSAAEKMGVNTGPPVNANAKKNPIMKFLSFVTDGQHQLNSAAEQVRQLNSSGQSVNAASLLLVQVKLQKAQQELDYSSVLLGKAVDIVKTLFNIQI